MTQADLSSEARQIFAKAEATDYSETYPLSAAREELLRALEKRVYIDENIRNDAGLRATREELIQ